MSKKNPSKIDQNNLFEEFKRIVPNVKPLKQNKVRLVDDKQSNIKKRHSYQQDDPASTRIFLSDIQEDPVLAEDKLIYSDPSISDKLLRKLKKGQYNIEAKLDLHGLTVAQAKQAVEHFLSICIESSMKTILIIHGKGRAHEYPVLKNKLNAWLRKSDAVLAFTSAAPRQGGLGALCVLLRKMQR